MSTSAALDRDLHVRRSASLSARLSRQERLVLLGAVLLGVSLFLPWYVTEPGNETSIVNGVAGEASAWETHEFIRWGFVFVLAHAAALLWNAIRGHAVPWLPGEPTMVQAVNGLGLVAYLGWLDRPGEPMGTISLGYGWWMALVGCVVMIVATATHAHRQRSRRLPPGVLR